MKKLRYNIHDFVLYIGEPFKVTKTTKNDSFLYGQPSYDIEATMPDEKGIYKIYKHIPQSLLK